MFGSKSKSSAFHSSQYRWWWWCWCWRIASSVRMRRRWQPFLATDFGAVFKMVRLMNRFVDGIFQMNFDMTRALHITSCLIANNTTQVDDGMREKEDSSWMKTEEMVCKCNGKDGNFDSVQRLFSLLERLLSISFMIRFLSFIFVIRRFSHWQKRWEIIDVWWHMWQAWKEE